MDAESYNSSGPPMSLASMPQEELAEGAGRPPVLPEKHVFLAHGLTEEAGKWAEGLRCALGDAGYKVAGGGAPGTDQLASDIRNCLKVVMLIDSEYLSTDAYKQTITFVEQLTSERQREVLIPVLSRLEYKDLPARLQFGSAVPVIGPTGNYPKASEHYWTRIVTSISEEVPVLSTVTSGVAYGLAWGYFFGYLHMILQGLSTRIQNYYDETKQDWECSEDAVLFTRMVAIIPRSVRLLTSLGQYDSDIEVVKSRSSGEPIKVKHTIDFPGHPKKDYSCTMFKTTVQGKEYLFFAEVPTTLNTLAKMRDSDVVQFDEDDHERELTRFQSSLETILATHRDDHTQARCHSIKILPYDETTDTLSEMIAREIDSTQTWEKAPWRPIAV